MSDYFEMTEKLRKPIRLSDRKLLKEIRKQPCVICNGGPSDACHVRSKGAGGDDAAHNILPMCRVHHREQHSVGFFKMFVSYPHLKALLLDMGWEIQETPRPRLVHPGVGG